MFFPKLKKRKNIIRMSIYKQLYQAGFDNDHSKIKELYQHKTEFYADMIAMGASSGGHSKLVEWAVNQGACFLFTIQQLNQD